MLNQYKVVVAFLVIAFLSVIVLPVFTMLVATPMFRGHISSHTEREALRFAHHLRKSHQERIGDSRRLIFTKEITEDIQREKEDLNLLRINVFDNRGGLVYSTDPWTEESEEKEEYFEKIILKGEVFSEFMDSEKIRQRGWPPDVRSVVETYVPIELGGTIVGAYEIYSDVTDNVEELDSAITSLYWVLGVITALLFAMVATSTVFIWRGIAERHKAAMALRQALDDKEMLFIEMNHRVKNNLNIAQALLSLQSARVEDADVRAMFDESANRLRSLSIVHEMLYKSSEFREVNFAAYLRELAQAVFENLKEEGSSITLQVDAEEIYLDTDKVIACGLMVNEMVTNALKHAFKGTGAGKLTVGLRRLDEGRCELYVTDDGAGLPVDVDVASMDTLGMQIIDGLVNQIEGVMEVCSGGVSSGGGASSDVCEGTGAWFSVVFKI
ncbi:MAG TPA: sensor histidine kinase [Nitrospirae bacterium]|nr:sensor histidine kinase [Nitrospirota bacterium]